jgi:hypothetical protein
MPRVIITAQVEDSEKWKEGFRTHGALFQDQTVKVLHFTANDENEVALYQEVGDLETYFKVMSSPETAEAMAFDGVKRETVKIFVLDEEFTL